MIKVYVTDSCPDCTQVKAQAINDPRFEVINIGEHVKNLKQFIALRDNNSAFDDAKAGGYLGIPCFVMEDGSVSFSFDEFQVEETHEGAACSLDGKGC